MATNTDRNKFRDAVLTEMAKSDNDINNDIRKHLTAIITACMAYKGKDFTFSANKTIEKKVDKILDVLSGDIYSSVYNRAKKAANIAFEQEHNKALNEFLIDFMALTIDKKTIADRIDVYINNLKNEFEAYVAVGIANGYNTQKIITMWLANKKKPLDFWLIKNNIGKLSAKYLQKDRYIGKGYLSSSYVGFTELERNNTFQSYNYTLNRIWQKQGMKYWYTVRGSNYPCEYCDSQVGIMHPITELFLGYHNRCMCVMIKVDENGKEYK